MLELGQTDVGLAEVLKQVIEVEDGRARGGAESRPSKLTALHEHDVGHKNHKLFTDECLVF